MHGSEETRTETSNWLEIYFGGRSSGTVHVYASVSTYWEVQQQMYMYSIFWLRVRVHVDLIYMYGVKLRS